MCSLSGFCFILWIKLISYQIVFLGLTVRWCLVEKVDLACWTQAQHRHNHLKSGPSHMSLSLSSSLDSLLIFVIQMSGILRLSHGIKPTWAGYKHSSPNIPIWWRQRVVLVQVDHGGWHTFVNRFLEFNLKVYKSQPHHLVNSLLVGFTGDTAINWVCVGTGRNPNITYESIRSIILTQKKCHFIPLFLD